MIEGQDPAIGGNYDLSVDYVEERRRNEVVFHDVVTPAQIDSLRRVIESGHTEGVTSTTHFTPAMARDLACLLLEAADICDYLNETGQNAERVAKDFEEGGSS